MFDPYNKDTQEMRNHEAQPSRTNNDKTNATYKTTDAQTKKNSNDFGMVCRKTEGPGGGVGELKLVLLARTFTLIS